MLRYTYTVCLPFCDAVILLPSKASYGSGNNELVRMWKEVVMARSDAYGPSYHLPGRTGTRYEPGTSFTRGRAGTHLYVSTRKMGQGINLLLKLTTAP